MINRVGMQLYTLRDLMKTPKEIAATLKQVKKIGYPAVQVSGIGAIEPKELRAIADDLDLNLCCSHIGYDDLMNNLISVVEKHHIWGCKQISVPVTPEKMRNGKGYVQFAKEMTKVGKKLADEGITLSYHNHAFEFEKFGKKTGMDLIYDNSDPKYFQAEIDVYWVQYGGSDPVAWCEKMKGRLPLVHLKDFGIVNNTPTYMEVGEGNIDMLSVIKACKKAKTQWYLVEQDICRRSPLESAKISFQNLKKLMAMV
jgi:sugar phosphate isomerase/epimerase